MIEPYPRSTRTRLPFQPNILKDSEPGLTPIAGPGYSLPLSWRHGRPEDHVFMKATLLAPTLNKIDGLRAIMPRSPRERLQQIFILDSGSSDGTNE
jgi:hypothetical protein